MPALTTKPSTPSNRPPNPGAPAGVNYSVMGVVDALRGNAIAEAYEYDPYGRHRVVDPGTDATYFTSDDTYDELHPGAINNAIRYTGQRFDAESGLMYHKNRYYDPAAGRFIGRDPLGWDEGPNRYGYVDGMPTMAVDPEGLQTVKAKDGFWEHFDKKAGNIKWAEWEILDELSCWTGNQARALNCYLEADMASRAGSNSERNAMRHCVWQCCLAQNFGSGFAKRLGDAHELGEPLEHPDHRADIINNIIGRRISEPYGPRGKRIIKQYIDCKKACQKEWDNGNLADSRTGSPRRLDPSWKPQN